jgi:hypothetical protein
MLFLCQRRTPPRSVSHGKFGQIDLARADDLGPSGSGSGITTGLAGAS